MSKKKINKENHGYYDNYIVREEECLVMLNMESFPCKHDNLLLVDIKTNFIHLG